MSKKEEFINTFKTLTGKSVADYKNDPGSFRTVLNDERTNLKEMFRQAVKECNASKSVPGDASAGLAFMFGND